MILFGGRGEGRPAPGNAAASASAFFDEAAYMSSVKDQAISQETTVFATAHCPEHRFLLAASNQGRLAVWDLTAYLFPSSSSSHQNKYTDRPVLHPGGLGAAAFPRQLQPGEARRHPQALVQKGWPRLSLQVSDRALNSIAFTPTPSGGRSSKAAGPSLVLAGDEGIFVYDWRGLLTLLQQEAPTEGPVTVAVPPPKARLCALPAGAARSWPYLTESNHVAVAEGGREAYSACGDAAVRCWDLEKGVCMRVLQGHTGYVHSVCPVPGAGLVLSGGEDGAVRAWDPRMPGDGQAAVVHAPWAAPVGGGGSSGSGGGGGDNSQALLQGSKWVAALAADPGGNFAVCGGGLEQAGVGKQGFVSVFHLPSMAVVASAATPSFVQDVCFLEDKIVSAGNEATVTHWSRPGLEAAARVTTDLPSVFSVNARAGPPQGDGVTVYAGCRDAVSVFVNPESRAFNLKFR